MKTVGIIAEFNPFHNGHLHLLEQAKKISGADYALVVMSGDFTQRGAPAILDKYARCKAALLCGADLVLELPVCYAAGSAEYFARGAVSLLDALGVSYVCFGSECGDLDALSRIADVLAKEPDSYKRILTSELKKGRSFPAARSIALDACLPDGCAELLQSPNNILGVEYLKAIRLHGASLKPCTVLRRSAGHADKDLPADGKFCSALALRRHILSGAGADVLSPYMPAASLSVLEGTLSGKRPLTEDDFSSVLFYRLLSEQEKGYASYADISDALSDKLSKNLESYSGFSRFVEKTLKTKDVTQTHLNRALLHILLDIRKEDLAVCAALGHVPYARILGLKKEASCLLGYFADPAGRSGRAVPVITRLSDADSALSPDAFRILQKDLFASHLYSGIFAQKNGGTMHHEYRRPVVTV